MLSQYISDLRSRGRRALIPYITAGYPTLDDTANLLDALVRAGADVIELGVPFSDPVADGPTIQRSSQRALENHTTLKWSLDVLHSFRDRSDVPVVLFTYLNPVLAFGVDGFLDAAVAAGANGVLLTDLPVGSDDNLEQRFEKSSLALIRLIAPTTPPDRIAQIAARAQGFLYYISRLGVTGARENLREELTGEIEALRRMTNVPIAVGFGISTAEQAATVAQAADGIVVGSAIIDAIDRGGISAAEDLLAGFRAAIDAVEVNRES